MNTELGTDLMFINRKRRTYVRGVHTMAKIQEIVDAVEENTKSGHGSRLRVVNAETGQEFLADDVLADIAIDPGSHHINRN